MVCLHVLFRRVQWYFGTKKPGSRNYIYVMDNLLKLPIFASFTLLGFFSLQVYTVTKFPFKAPHFWKRKRVALCCVGLWLIAGLHVSGSFFFFFDQDFDKWRKWWTVQAVVWSIIVIIQIVLKILTCWEIFKSQRNSGQSQISKRRQITTTVMIMVAVQIFTALPFVVTNQLLFFLNIWPQKIITIQWCLALPNFCVNPIIYFLRLPDYRSSLLSLLRCRKRKQKISIIGPRRNNHHKAPFHLSPSAPQSPY